MGLRFYVDLQSFLSSSSSCVMRGQNHKVLKHLKRFQRDLHLIRSKLVFIESRPLAYERRANLLLSHLNHFDYQIRVRSRQQCDQMARLLLNISPFTTIKIYPIAQKLPIKFKVLPNTLQIFKNGQKYLIFCQSGAIFTNLVTLVASLAPALCFNEKQLI